MLVEKIYILGALLKLPFFTHDEEMKNWANSYLTFHSWSPYKTLILMQDNYITFQSIIVTLYTLRMLHIVIT